MKNYKKNGEWFNSNNRRKSKNLNSNWGNWGKLLMKRLNNMKRNISKLWKFKNNLEWNKVPIWALIMLGHIDLCFCNKLNRKKKSRRRLLMIGKVGPRNFLIKLNNMGKRLKCIINQQSSPKKKHIKMKPNKNNLN